MATTKTNRPTAKFCKIVAGYLMCPGCQSEIESPTGSLLWTTEHNNPRTVDCQDCGTTVFVPLALIGK